MLRVRTFVVALPVLWMTALPWAAAAADTRVRVAVLPVVVHSLDASSYLRDGLADMLAARLGRTPRVAVLRVDDPTKATSQADAARQAAREVGATYVLFGSFTHFGEGASLDLRCLRVDRGEEGAARSIFIQAGTLAEIIPSLDGLADRVVRYVLGAPAPEGEDLPGGPIVAGQAGALADALSELESLRQRVDRLEEKLHGEASLAGEPGLDLAGENPPVEAGETGSLVR